MQAIENGAHNHTRPACGAIKQDGQPCRAPALSGGLCFAHDPDRAEARTRARAKGGRNRSRAARAEKLMPAVLQPVLYSLLDTMAQTRAGRMQPSQATAIAAVAGAIVRTFEHGQLEERLRALEDKSVGGWKRNGHV